MLTKSTMKITLILPILASSTCYASEKPLSKLDRDCTCLEDVSFANDHKIELASQGKQEQALQLPHNEAKDFLEKELSLETLKEEIALLEEKSQQRNNKLKEVRKCNDQLRNTCGNLALDIATLNDKLAKVFDTYKRNEQKLQEKEAAMIEAEQELYTRMRMTPGMGKLLSFFGCLPKKDNHTPQQDGDHNNKKEGTKRGNGNKAINKLAPTLDKVTYPKKSTWIVPERKRRASDPLHKQPSHCMPSLAPLHSTTSALYSMRKHSCISTNDLKNLDLSREKMY